MLFALKFEEMIWSKLFFTLFNLAATQDEYEEERS